MNWAATGREPGPSRSVGIGALRSDLSAKTSQMSIMRIITKVNAMRIHHPPHPGEILKKLCLEPLGLTVTSGDK